LPRRNCSGAKNSSGYGCQERVFDCLAHDSLSFSLIRYFPEGATPASFVVQNAVNGVVKEQTQPWAHGWVALQEPPQVVEPLAPLCNCRVETVPAQRTASAMTTNDRFWIYFFMANLLSGRCRYFSTVAPGMGCDEQKGVPVSIGKIHRQRLAQGLLTPQPPPQVTDPSASLRNCRAETVPAQRTPMTSAVKNIDLIFFMISSLSGPNRSR
jgi:hypothetical protein